MWEDIKKKNFIHMGDWANLAKQQINGEYNEDKEKKKLEQFTLLCCEGICVN